MRVDRPGSPSPWLLYLIFIFALAGLFVSVSLAASHYLGAAIPCLAASDCDGVTRSRYGYFLGVPLSIWGSLVYLVLAALAVLSILRPKWASPALSLSRWLTLFGVLFSVTLLAIINFKLHASCTWCLASALIMSLSSCVHSFLAIRGQRSTSWSQPTRRTPVLLGILFIAFLLPQVAYVRGQAERQVFDQSLVGSLGAKALEAWGGHSLGDPGADLKLMVFSDLLCPACKSIVPRLIAQVRRNQPSHLVYRHFPLPTHPEARIAAAIAEVAADTGLFWDFVSHADETAESRDDFLSIARELGVPADDLQRINRKKDQAWDAVNHDLAIARSLGLPGTPMIILFRPGQRPRLVTPREAEIALSE